MKIKSLQNGGIYYTPFFRESVYKNAGTQSNKSYSTSDNDKEAQLIQKEIINILKEAGLPSDVDYFLSKANSFLSKSSNLGPLFGDNISSNYNMSDLIVLQSLANKTRHNAELYKKANDQVTAEGSGSEVAITNTGGLYVADKNGGIKAVSLSTYYKNKDQYNPLTNSELLRLRAEQPELAYNGSIIADLTNSVGMKSIVDYVKSTISTFGTDKQTSSSTLYAEKNKSKITEGFEKLLDPQSPDGIYKITQEISNSHQGYDSSTGSGIVEAVNYLYRTLPANMKNVLRVNAAAEGLDPNNVRDIQNLLVLAVAEHTNHSTETSIDIDYDKSLSSSGSGSGSGGSEKDIQSTRHEAIVRGAQVVPQEHVINASDSTIGIKYSGQDYGRPEDTNSKQIGMASITDVFTRDPVGQSVEMGSISFSGQTLNEQDLNRIVYDGISTMQRAVLPVDKNEEMRTGKVVPDFKAAQRFEQFKEWLNEGYGIMPNTILMKAKELDLDIYYDENSKTFKFNYERPFLLLNGYASSVVTDIDEDSTWIQRLKNDEAERVYDNYFRAVNYGTLQPTKGMTKRDSASKHFWSGNNDMYKGIIAAPLNDPAIATVISNHELLPASAYRDILNRRTILDKSRIKTTWD